MTEAKCLACDGSRIAPWSTARDIEYLSTSDAFDYVRCGDCGALSIASVPRDRLGEIYPETYYSFSGGKLSPVERVKQWLDRRLFRKLLSDIPGDRLAALDVGGGTGWLLSQARAVEPRLTRTAVVDLDAKAEAEAVAQGHEFHLGRIEEFNSNARFDLILLLNLIEHVEDPVAVLGKMRDLLAPGGRILVKTPNHDSLDARLFRHRSWGGYHCPRHWVIFTPESFARAAGAAGLDVERTQLTQGAPFWAVSIMELLSRRGLARVDRDRPMCRHPLFGPLLGLFAAFDILRAPFGRTSQMFIHLKAA